MIFITGDCHCNARGEMQKFNTDRFPIQKEMTKDDYVIVCGDFGFCFAQEESKEERFWLDWLEKKPWTTLFIDGNHENFDRLYTFPLEEWNGGHVRKLRPSVMHLMRGDIFNIDGCTFFAMGGAACHDIQDGVLEIGDPRIKEWSRDYNKMFRINKLSWWEQEVPNESERAYALRNLAKVNNKVDYILTHEGPASDVVLLGKGWYNPDEYSRWLEELRTKIDYRRWYFGHYHMDRLINIKEECLYDGMVCIR